MIQQYKYITIEFKNIATGKTVEFKFKPKLENQITHRWLELVDIAVQLYPIDQPGRFYDFNSHEDEEKKALDWIQRDINTINSHNPPVVERTLDSVHDQDTLNYLHHIFEVYHGLLDQQTSEYWKNAPTNVKLALADLNIDVHRCEHIHHRDKQTPRFVSTWYGLPKTHHYFEEDYKLFTNEYEFGTIYLNYCEVGKTLEDMCKDKEFDDHSYAAAEAFKPFDYITADFHVKFFNSDPHLCQVRDEEMWDCFDKNAEFFTNRGYTKYDKRLSSGLLPVANIATELSNDEIINILKDHQYVSNVSIEYE